MEIYPVIPQDLHTSASPIFAGLTITGNSVFGLNSSVFQPAAGGDSTTFFQILNAAGAIVGNWDTTNKRLGIATNSPNAPFEVKGLLPGDVGGDPSGLLHVTNGDISQFSNSVITGHNSYNTNTQLWYLGSVAGANNDIAFINRQDAALSLRTNDTERLKITKDGDIGVNVTDPTARLHLPAGTAAVGTAPLKFTSGTDLTTPEAGVIEYDGSHFSVTEVMDRRVLSVASDSVITAVTVVDTVSEITVFTAPISADELHVGKVFRIYGFGEASTHDANDTLTIRIKIGGTLLTSLGAIPGQAADDPFHFVNTITVRTTGGGGTIASHGHIMIKNTEVHQNDQDVVVNTTTAENITVTLQWNDANAGNTATLDQCFLEVLV